MPQFTWSWCQPQHQTASSFGKFSSRAAAGPSPGVTLTATKWPPSVPKACQPRFPLPPLAPVTLKPYRGQVGHTGDVCKPLPTRLQWSLSPRPGHHGLPCKEKNHMGKNSWWGRKLAWETLTWREKWCGGKTHDGEQGETHVGDKLTWVGIAVGEKSQRGKFTWEKHSCEGKKSCGRKKLTMGVGGGNL